MEEERWVPSMTISTITEVEFDTRNTRQQGDKADALSPDL
jgi:hypothetical protein